MKIIRHTALLVLLFLYLYICVHDSGSYFAATMRGHTQALAYAAESLRPSADFVVVAARRNYAALRSRVPGLAPPPFPNESRAPEYDQISNQY